MTDSDDLLRAVIANPDDDTPRLIYADWLDDHGDHARAEFIRVQIERWNRFGDSTPMSDLEYVALLSREKALFSLHFESWLEPLRRKGEPFQSRDTHGVYRRGFMEEVWMRAKTFLNRGEKLFRRVPIRTLKLTQASADEFGSFVAMPVIARVTCLDLRPLTWTMRHFDDFIGSKSIRQIRRIEIDADRWSVEIAEQFASSGPVWSETEFVFHIWRRADPTIGGPPFHFIDLPQVMDQLRRHVRKLTTVHKGSVSITSSES